MNEYKREVEPYDLPVELIGAYSTWKKKDNSGEDSNRHTYIPRGDGKVRNIARAAFKDRFESYQAPEYKVAQKIISINKIMLFPHRENIVPTHSYPSVGPAPDSNQEAKYDFTGAPAEGSEALAPIIDFQSLVLQPEAAPAIPDEVPALDEGIPETYLHKWPAQVEEEDSLTREYNTWPARVEEVSQPLGLDNRTDLTRSYEEFWPWEKAAKEAKAAQRETEQLAASIVNIDRWLKDDKEMYDRYKTAETEYIDAVANGKKGANKSFEPFYIEARNRVHVDYHDRFPPSYPEQSDFTLLQIEQNMANLFLAKIANESTKYTETKTGRWLSKATDKFSGFKKRLQGKPHYTKTGDPELVLGNRRSSAKGFIESWYHQASVEDRSSINRRALALAAIESVR